MQYKKSKFENLSDLSLLVFDLWRGIIHVKVMKALKLWIVFLVYKFLSYLVTFTHSSSYSSYDPSPPDHLEGQKDEKPIAEKWSKTFSSYPRCNFSALDDQDLSQPDLKESCNTNNSIIPVIVGTERFGPVCLKTWKKGSRVEEIFVVEYASRPGILDVLELKIGKPYKSSCSQYVLFVEKYACILSVFFDMNDVNLISTHHTPPKIEMAKLNTSVWRSDKDILKTLTNTTNIACNYSNYDVAESTAYRYCRRGCYDIIDRYKAKTYCRDEGCYCTLSYKKRFIECNSITYSIPVQYSFSNGETRITEGRSYVDEILPDTFSRYTTLVRLMLKYGKLRKLSSDTFKNLTHLNYLNLQFNRLEFLPVDVFGDLVNLKTLLLSWNQLNVLHEDIFRTLIHLRRISLAVNRLKSLPKFYGKLRDNIHLSKNELTSLRNDCFAGFVEATNIYLDQNSLKILPEELFKDTVSLKWLDLSENFITFLPSNLFSSLQNLEYLHLHNNQLNNIPPASFNSTRSLKYLILHNNNLLILDAAIFKPLSQLIYLNVMNSRLAKEPLIFGLGSLQFCKLDHNNLTNLNANYFAGLFNLEYLSVEYNYVDMLVEGLFKDLYNLKALYFNDNLLYKISRRAFGDNTKLRFVSLANNQLKIIPVDSFAGLINLASLDIQQNYLHNLQGTFDDLKNIQTINASYNSITTINTIINSSHSVILDLRENTLSWVKKSSFKFTKWVDFTVLVDESATCCFVDNAVCLPINPPPVYLTCKRMLDSTLLRFSMSILGLFAILFNFLVFFRRVFYKKDYRVQSVLIVNLSVSDFMMGINMILLATADAYYTDYFASFSEKWRNGVLCKIASILSILSSEVSVFFITFITIDRWKGVKHVFSANQISLKRTKILILLIWITGLVLSVTPTFLADLFPDIYEISEVCVGLPMVKRPIFVQGTNQFTVPIPRWFLFYDYTYGGDNSIYSYYYVYDKLFLRYTTNTKSTSYATSEVAGTKLATYFSLVTFLGLNLICFILVAVVYVDIFNIIRKTSKASGRTTEAKVETRRAMKMFAIVFTDFCTWVPLVFVCILAQFGVVEVDPQVYAWTVAFILPINSAINPFLYTLVALI